tara:strand:- start:653 stop:829 length:177 start_codon:yes stop_codon:yes gene_type:complete
MEQEARHMVEAITFMKEEQTNLKVPTWYIWLDRVLALAFYLLMGYVYLSIVLWLISAK